MSERHGVNGGKASDWLRQARQQESRFHPKSFATFSERYPFRALRLLIPSRLEGMWGIVDRKAGGLADAQHILEWYIYKYEVTTFSTCIYKQMQGKLWQKIYISMY